MSTPFRYCVASVTTSPRRQTSAAAGDMRAGSLAWRSDDGNWVWAFLLEESNGASRLISRNRFRLSTLAARVGMLPMELGSLLMERRMLRGIKDRAERLAPTARQA